MVYIVPIDVRAKIALANEDIFEWYIIIENMHICLNNCIEFCSSNVPMS
jgi:hypothetical protein